MQKQAFLIIAHDNFSVLEKLIKVLHSPRVDIYLHLDSKVKDIPAFLKDADVKLLAHRIDTRWGDISQIETEYALFKESFAKGKYSYYHMISGTHFPLAPIETILDTFDSWKGKTVLSGLCIAAKHQEYQKLRRYNILTRHLSYGPVYLRRLCQYLRRLSLSIQSSLNIERNKGVSFYKASNWASFSEEAVDYLLSHKDYVMKVFRYTFCGDEFFAPTLLMNSTLNDKVVNYNQYLIVQMGEANPRELTETDFDMVMNSGCMFARKFSDSNISVVNKIIAHNEL